MTVKKKAKTKTSAKAAKAAPRRKKSRAAKIREALQAARTPQTVREICQAIHLKAEDAKFVSSILISFQNNKEVTVKEKTCSVSNREVHAYTLRKSA